MARQQQQQQLRHLCRLCLGTLAAAVLLWRPAVAVTPLSDWASGIATNYGGPADGMSPYDPSYGTLEGSCGYGAISKTDWPYWSVAAISPATSFYQQGPAGACGECFEIQCMSTGEWAGNCITGPDQVSVVVQITDSCPECEANHFDLQALTYNKISPIATGRISIQYRRVECVPPGRMSVVVDNNNGPYGWLRMFVASAGGVGAVKLVQVRQSGASALWTNMQNTYGSAWEVPNAPSYPLDVNIISSDGESVTAYQAITGAGQLGDMPTSVQFSIANPADTSLTQPVSASASATASASASATPATPVAQADTTSSAAISSAAATVSTQSATVDSASSASTGCVDIPIGDFTCAQQAANNQCGEPWMAGHCQQTCGTCQQAAGTATTPPAAGALPPPVATVAAASPPPIPGTTAAAALPPPAPVAATASPPPATAAETQPPGGFTCAQQASWGMCSQPWMVNGGFCTVTCGAGGRRLLRHPIRHH